MEGCIHVFMVNLTVYFLIIKYEVPPAQCSSELLQFNWLECEEVMIRNEAG